MAIITVQKNGIKAGVGGAGARDRKPPEKTALAGWSQSSIRRNNDFLRSVDYARLNGMAGLAFTGTVKHCPDSSDEWQRILRAFWRRLRRMDVGLVHYVTEWQRRGVPHVHCSLFWVDPDPMTPAHVIGHWLDLTGHLGAESFGQRITTITDALGWAQYTSKHAQRGLFHYQRTPEAVPVHWGGKTGRMWGKLGNWPIWENVRLAVSGDCYHKFRRIVRAWRIADARSSGCRRRIRSARRMLKCNDRPLSAVRGLSEWLPDSQTLPLMDWLQSQGHDLLQVG